MIKAVLFDYGGTLFKSKRSWTDVKAEGFESATKVLADAGVKVSPARFAIVAAAVFEEYAEKETEQDRDLPDLTKYQEIIDKICPAVPKKRRSVLASRANRAFWDTATESYPMRKSAKKALEGLEARGIRMGVVSNHHDHAALVNHLADSGLHSKFVVVLSSEKEGVRKPNTAIFEKCLKSMKVSKKDALFVGDSPRHDIEGAKAAGMTTVLIDDGDKSKRRQVAEKRWTHSEVLPDYKIKDLLELPGIVDSLRKPQLSKKRVGKRR